MKRNRIKVVVSGDGNLRLAMVAKLMIKDGLAKTASDAKKIMQNSLRGLSITDSYFVACPNYSFSESPLTNYRLIEMAVSGLSVIVGVKKLPHEFEYLSEVYTVQELGIV